MFNFSFSDLLPCSLRRAPILQGNTTLTLCVKDCQPTRAVLNEWVETAWMCVSCLLYKFCLDFLWRLSPLAQQTSRCRPPCLFTYEVTLVCEKSHEVLRVWDTCWCNPNVWLSFGAELVCRTLMNERKKNINTFWAHPQIFSEINDVLLFLTFFFTITR